MDYKIVFAIIATILGTVSFVPYLRDILKNKTKPHLYTWLIWLITQGVAIGGVWQGGGGIASMGMLLGQIFILSVIFLSFARGTKNITVSDTVVLIISFLAILVWWKLDNLLAAVIIVTAVDLIAYWPSYRKSFFEPWSETVVTWSGFVLSNIFAMLALREYNLLTMTYLLAITVANAFFVGLCLVRRRYVPAVGASH